MPEARFGYCFIAVTDGDAFGYERKWYIRTRETHDFI